MRKVFRARDIKHWGRQAAASLLTVTVTLATVPPVIAGEPVVGTIQVSGPAWAATPSSDWAKIAATRPLVAGDRLKTETGGHLVADLGKLGVVGLYGNSEISVARQGNDLVVDVQRGKVAFHLEPGSRLKMTSRGAAIAAGAQPADGYVEFDAAGAPVVVVEGDTLSVALAGGVVKTLSRGERLALTGGPNAVPSKVATTEEDERKAGAAAAPPEAVRKKYAGLSTRGWTALAVVAVAVGVGVGVGVGGGGGGGGDNNPSPSGE